MRIVRWSAGEQEYYLAYTVDAMLELQEEAGEVGQMAVKLSKNNREGVDLLCRCLHILSREGERVRRAAGYEERHIPEESEFRPLISPRNRVELVEAVTRAISLGLMTEEESEEEIDLVLMDLQKKTEIRTEGRSGQRPTA